MTELLTHWSLIMTSRFKSKFDDYVCCSDKIVADVDGFMVIATVEYDGDTGTPWEYNEGHGPVSEWTSRDKRPGERVLIADGKSKRYYHYAEAIKIAKRDGWDAEPYGQGTRGEQAVRAVEADFNVLQAWCNDEWSYCSIVLSVFREDVELDGCAASLSGIELNYPGSDNSYLNEVADELLDEAIEKGREVLNRLIQSLD
jgi:hypothetical protein